MAHKIWTTAQAQDLDRRFGEVHKRIDDTNKRIDDLRDEMNTKFDLVFKYLNIIMSKLDIKIEE